MTAGKSSTSLAMLLSLISNIVLTVMKITIGYLFNSQVLFADGVHNAGDVIATLAAFSAMRISKIPADEQHPYGHGKAEVLASAIVSIILAFAALYIAYEAILALFEEPSAPSFLALTAAFISLIWKQALYVYTMGIGKRENSKATIATAYDHLADVYASIAAVIGLGLGFLGEHYGIEILGYGDPLAGIIVSILVLKLVVHLGKDSLGILMEKNVEQDKLDQYASLIHSHPEVKRIDRLRARDHGHYILVDARVSVSASLTIQEGHDISREIKKLIMDNDTDVDEVLVHLNPWYESDNIK